MQIVGGDEVTVRHGVQPGVLEVPYRSGLANESALETDHARLLTHDPRVLAELAFRGRSLVIGNVGRERELRDFARHDAR